MKIEIINSHFNSLETKDILQQNNIIYTFNENGGELDTKHYQVLININTLEELMTLKQEIGQDIIISDYYADDKTTKIFLLIYDDYLE